MRQYFAGLKWYWLLIVLLLALAYGAAWLWLKPDSSVPVIALDCRDVRFDCGSQTVRVRFSQQPQAMQAFEVILSGPQATAVHLDFAMPGMAMGLNRYRMIQQGRDWQARVILPACVQGRQDWQMRITLEQASPTGRQVSQYSIAFVL